MTLIDTFLKAKGWQKGSEKTHIAPFLPYLVADALYLVHEEHLKGQLKQKAKRHANKMMEAYHRFIHDFFACFPREQQNELIAMMDALDTHIHNDIEVLRMQAQNVVIAMPPEQRNIFSAVAAVRVLSANIKYSWQSIYRRSASEAIPNKDIDGIYHHGCELFREYSKNTPRYLEHTDLGNYPHIQQAEKALINSIIGFIEKYNNGIY